jgi:hypothetical protein
MDNPMTEILKMSAALTLLGEPTPPHMQALILDYVLFLEEKLSEFMESADILDDPRTMEALKESLGE